MYMKAIKENKAMINIQGDKRGEKRKGKKEKIIYAS